MEIVLESRQDVLRVPTEAVLENDRALVFNENTGRLEKRRFKPGISNWRFTEVVEGLQAQERVVVSVDREGVEAGVLVTPEESNTEEGTDSN